MGTRTNGKEKLPKELQEYKKKLKELDFMGKVKAYFDCAPFVRDIDSKKKVLIYNSFTRKEKELYSSKYAPIYSAIDRYGDRVRAINGNCFIYAFYVDTILRQKDAFSYTADLLNGARRIAGEALEGTEEVSTKEKLERLQRSLSCFTYSNIYSPKITESYRHGHNGQILNPVQDDILKKCRLLVGMPFACVQEHTGRWQVLPRGTFRSL